MTTITSAAPASLAADACYAARFSDELRFSPALRVGRAETTVSMQQRDVRLHSALPPTPMWVYVVRQDDEDLISPTWVARAWEPISIRWANDLTGRTLPIKACVSWYAGPDPDGPAVVSNYPGAGCAEPDYATGHGVRTQDGSFRALDEIPPVAAPHLHGGFTEARSDGWTENMILAGQASSYRYANKQPATMLWYHDHAMSITRLNVYAGLAGLILTRDADDDRIVDALQLAKAPRPHAGRPGHGHEGGHGRPLRPAYELPLLIQDCNLETDAAGAFTGQLVHKVDGGTGPMEFFGPYTLVNRQLWPRATVNRRQYRLRLINGSNARTFRLSLLDEDGTPVSWAGFATIIGTDGGLRGQPITAPEHLILAPAERLDVIVDFAAVAASRLTVVNTAEAPYGRGHLPARDVEATPGEEHWDARLRYPAVLRFDLTGPAEPARPIPPLASAFRRIVHAREDAAPGERVVVIPPTRAAGGHGHVHRLVALVEEELVPDQPATLTLRELVPYHGGETPAERLVTITEPGGPPVTYRTAAKLFHDAPTFLPLIGDIEVWKVINLSADTHPFHVHLTQLQVLGRLGSSPGLFPEIDPSEWPHPERPPLEVVLDQVRPIDGYDHAAKDVVRVAPEELVKLAVPIGIVDPVHDVLLPDAFAGQFMYHCHILEHEDHDMMRAFIVIPEGLDGLMVMHHH